MTRREDLQDVIGESLRLRAEAKQTRAIFARTLQELVAIRAAASAARARQAVLATDCGELCEGAAPGTAAGRS